MKRNVYLILITVITILCIIAGTGYLWCVLVSPWQKDCRPSANL